ncbi:MAG: hypothetical protein WC587_03415 [Candidatus Paceibacterota bacterium]
MSKNILIKISGDLIRDDKVLNFIKRKSKNARVVVLVGAGSDISNSLIEKKINFKFTGIGRIIKNVKGKEVARKILSKNKKELQNKLAKEKIKAIVEIPVIKLGNILCHINGDILAAGCSVNFDETNVITQKGRNKNLKGHNLKIIKI